MLSVRGLRVTYGEAVALAGIDLDAPTGQTTALLGPSGCGKSTLLRAVVGLVHPDAGTIALRGEPITDWTEARQRLGYVIQEGGLFPHLSGADNVALMARHRGWAEPRIAARIAELAELTQLPPELLLRVPRELSGGQRQRVALMRALMLDPDLLLLDEPLGALDPLIRADLQRELRGIFGRLGKTVLLVTHDLVEARRLADTVVLLQDGVVVQAGTLDELADAPADPFVTRFLSAWDAS